MGDESIIDNHLGNGVMHWDGEVDEDQRMCVPMFAYVCLDISRSDFFIFLSELFTSCQDTFSYSCYVFFISYYIPFI